MKRIPYSHLMTGLFCLAMISLSTRGHAQTTNFIVDQFDTDTTAFLADLAWGTTAPTISWDGSVNATTTLAPNVEGSGSSMWSIDWSVDPPADQVMVNRRFPDEAVLDLVNYTNVSFDVRFAADSTTDGQSRFGAIEVDWTPQSEGWPSTSAGSAFFYTTNTDWVHVEIPIDAATNPKLKAVTHVGFKLQQSRTGSALTGTSTFWLDNIILHARTTVVPSPKLSIAPVTTPPGLMAVAPGGGNGYRRAMIRTLDPAAGQASYSWVGHGATPITYGMTIASYPQAYHYFQSQIFLVPNGGNDTSVDYNAATVMALDIRNIPDGTATAAFRYKTNHAYANASDFVPAVLVCSNGVIGSWSITFVNDTNVTVTAPNNVTTNFSIPEAVAMEFIDPVTVYFGNQQNGDNNAGQAATYSRVKVAGPTQSPEFDETFSGPELNPDPENAKWQVVCDVPSCVLVVRPEDKFWLSWTVPDSGFSFQSRSNLLSGTWDSAPPLTNVVNTTLGNRMLLPQSSMPSSQMGFFRLIKPGT